MGKVSRNTSKLISCILLIGLCTLGIFYSGKWLAAEYYANKVLKQRDLWESYGDIYFLEEWETALDNINTAIELHDSKAEFYRLQGLVYEWRRVAPIPENDDLNPMQKLRQTISIQTEARQNSLNAYRKSLSLRPTWPLVWYKVAYLKGMLNEFDEEFLNSMHYAYLYGKNLNFMQDNLSELSLRFFEEIQSDEGLQEMQLTHLAKTLNTGSARAQLNLINRFRLLDDVCLQLSENGYQINSTSEQACNQREEQGQ